VVQLDDAQVRELIGQLEKALDRIESLPDNRAREAAADAVQMLVQVYGEALRRIVERAAAADSADVLHVVTEDELVSHLLLVHDLHPARVEDRIAAALEEVRPYLDSHGGDVDLLRVENGVAHLRLQGSCKGCPSSTVTLRTAIEDAVLRAAPELEGIEAEGASDTKAGFVPLGSVGMGNGAGRDGRGAGEEGIWTVVGALPQLAQRPILHKEISGQPVLFARLGGTFYAYRGPCPSCAASLSDVSLEGSDVVCAQCGRRYDVRRAGRCSDGSAVVLEPIPLLTDEGGMVRLALTVGGAPL
jgi:Fe-S cluster biogenesis protein NfuA/nitrite reductase/ring-hydroxylating ferredoxin subunit